MTLYAMPKPSSMFFPPSITCKKTREQEQDVHPDVMFNTSKVSCIYVKRIIEYCDDYNWNLTLQATSTFMGLPPNSVGGELDPEDLREGVLVWGALEEAAVSQRWRKRVTSSWSSIVFMCLMKIKRGQIDRGQRVDLVPSRFSEIRINQITWTHHWMTSSSWMSWPETFSSQHPDPAAPAGTSSGALWLWPTSAGQGQGHGQNPQMSKETFFFVLKSKEIYLLFSQL